MIDPMPQAVLGRLFSGDLDGIQRVVDCHPQGVAIVIIGIGSGGVPEEDLLLARRKRPHAAPGAIMFMPWPTLKAWTAG